MENLLGIGGESIVIKQMLDTSAKAFKIIAADGITSDDKNIVTQAQNQLQHTLPNSINPANVESDEISIANLSLISSSAETACTEMRHKNIISYDNVTIDIIQDQVVYVVGMSIFVNFNKLNNHLF